MVTYIIVTGGTGTWSRHNSHRWDRDIVTYIIATGGTGT